MGGPNSDLRLSLLTSNQIPTWRLEIFCVNRNITGNAQKALLSFLFFPKTKTHMSWTFLQQRECIEPHVDPTCRIQKPDIPRAGRGELTRVRRQGGARRDGSGAEQSTKSMTCRFLRQGSKDSRPGSLSVSTNKGNPLQTESGNTMTA